MILSWSVLLVQGAGVAEAAFNRFKLGLLMRIAIYAALLWTGGLLPGLVLLGLADLWANFRKLPRGAVPEPPLSGQ
jgi:hypothetical protein